MENQFDFDENNGFVIQPKFTKDEDENEDDVKNEDGNEHEGEDSADESTDDLNVQDNKYIFFIEARNRFVVTVIKNKKPHYLGSFLTQEEAKRTRDTFLKGETVINPANAHGKYITYVKARNRFVAKVYMKRKQHFLGYFLTQKEAICVRDKFLGVSTVVKHAEDEDEV